MPVPNLKRVKVSSVEDLRHWLARNSGQEADVMIVTCDKSSPTKHIPSSAVRDALVEFGWSAERTYALNGNLLGHVARLQ